MIRRCAAGCRGWLEAEAFDARPPWPTRISRPPKRPDYHGADIPPGTIIQLRYFYSRDSHSASLKTGDKMFATTWFMYPWQATRIAIETQSVITCSVLRLLSGTHTQTAPPRPHDRDAVDTEEGSVAIKPRKTVAAHGALGMHKKRLRPTNKRLKRKRKSKSR